jgi:hypothetical protein
MDAERRLDRIVQTWEGREITELLVKHIPPPLGPAPEYHPKLSVRETRLNLKRTKLIGGDYP